MAIDPATDELNDTSELWEFSPEFRPELRLDTDDVLFQWCVADGGGGMFA